MPISNPEPGPAKRGLGALVIGRAGIQVCIQYLFPGGFMAMECEIKRRDGKITASLVKKCQWMRIKLDFVPDNPAAG